MESEQHAENFIRLPRHELLDIISWGAVVLTGNARLARHLVSEFERRMLDLGHKAWATPAVLPLNAWLLETFDRHLLISGRALPRLLTPDQEKQVWASIIAREGPGLLRVDATANRAKAAWKLVCDWQLDLADPRFSGNENGEAFRRWAVRFRTICEKDGLATESELAALLGPFIASGECRVRERIMLAGFYDPAPAQRYLATALRESGCAAEWVEITGRPGRVRRRRAPDAHHENAEAAEWARQILLADPDSRIGIVVPDLAARRSSLAHRFCKTLNPGSMRPGASDRPDPWNISLGVPLSRVPIVRTALGLLTLIKSPVEVAGLGTLLGSANWGLPQDGAERSAELNRRALLDRRLRSIGDVAMPLSSIRYEASRSDESNQLRPWACTFLAARLESLVERLRELPGRGPAADWAKTFAGWLTLAGWPQGRPLDSREFQAVEAWNDLLSGFSALSDFAGVLTRGEALALLGRLAGERLFQPQGGESPVQVLGLYEANSLRFDHLWVMGLHDQAWPPATSADPFIPLAIQRECGMPHCTPEVQRAWAARLTAQLSDAAADVMFSWPCREGGDELECSPLIGHVEDLLAGESAAAADKGWFRLIQESATPEIHPASPPIPLRHAEVAGGSRVYAHQAACPFRAFAEHRLGARPLDRPEIGLGPRRGGTLVHRVLESFWRDLRTHEALCTLGRADVSTRVRAAVEEALEAQRRRSPVTLSPRYLALEAGRLHDRIMDWLELERQRAPFRVVDLELHKDFKLSGVRVDIFVDRIDELQDGARVVIDHKTGQVSPSGWFGDRPHDPQLPLYGVATKAGAPRHPLAAVAFAQIRADRAGFSGVVRDTGILPGLPASRPPPLKRAAEDWPAVLDDWADVLERLAAAFHAGRAEVDPRNGLNTCRQGHCELAPLCRVRERLPGLGDEFPAGGGPTAVDDANGGDGQDGWR
jgi:probable DNA repair protein